MIRVHGPQRHRGGAQGRHRQRGPHLRLRGRPVLLLLLLGRPLLSKSGIDDLDHTVLAVGYEGTEGSVYTIVKNSRSQAWATEAASTSRRRSGVATQPRHVTLAVAGEARKILAGLA